MGAEFYRVEPEAGEPVVVELILRSRGIRSVVLIGLATNVSVESTARDAYRRDYCVTLVDDCSATYDAKHAATLHNLDDHFGVVAASRSCRSYMARSAGLPRWSARVLI